MEKWKLAAIAAMFLVLGGFGWLNNRPVPTTVGNSAALVAPPAFVPDKPSKFNGKTIPSLASITTWANTKTPVDFAQFKGHPIFFEVFRTECSHCQAAAPFLVELHKRYAPRGVVFIAVQSPSDNPDPDFPENSWPTVQGWIKEKGYTWPVGFDPKRAWFKKSYGNDVTYPSMFLLDKHGKVVYFHTGHTDASAMQLSVQLERLAPGNGDASARAKDIINWVMNGTQSSADPKVRTALQSAVSSYLATKSA